MICTCSNDRFIGHQIIRADVIVGADGSFRAPCMGNNLAVKVRYALGSRER